MAECLAWSSRTGAQLTTAAIDVRHIEGLGIHAQSSRRESKKGERITVENAERLLKYLPQFKVLICIEHRYALQNVERHLQDYHTGKAKEKREVLNQYAQFELANPQDIQLPDPLHEPIDELGKPLRALICEEEECEFITIHREAMRRHCKVKHDWHSTRGQREYWHEIWAQTFFIAGKQKYFSVL